jgi:glycosyltransferase involved in cell wall biosynthesis
MITFIIPTIGKDTLKNSIESLENQTNQDWKAIIIFDGLKPNIEITNPKITVLDVEKNGNGGNGAGAVRNYGMERVDTDWIGFLDDDDTLAPDYVETFYNEIKEYPYVDAIIFRLYRDNWEPHVIPFLDTTDTFHANEVGISFAVKTEIVKAGRKFETSVAEDFMFLSLMRGDGKCIMISPHIKYFVHGKNDIEKTSVSGTRVFINKKEEGFSLINRPTIKSEDYIPLLFLFFVIMYAMFSENKKLVQVLLLGLFIFFVTLGLTQS